ncbi:sensor histidine kinase [Rhodovulum sp. DZ06]|uniref:sensor histidine kinase n=1 Tax=Rhodovulum sp. DZ06 TaxID=3425126 RepID=UPI003D34C24A
MPFARSVRFRLLLIALIPLLVVLPILLAASGAGWLRRFDELAAAKVSSDLTVARQHLSGLIDGTAAGLESLARSAEFERALGRPAAMTALLMRERGRLGLDHLHFIHPAGDVTGAPSMGAADPLIDAPQVWSAFAGRPAAGIERFGAARLSAISPVLAARARLPLIPTEAAAPTEREVEDRGLVVLAAAPASDGGALVGGVLLNRNLQFIDRINELVYSEAGLVDGSRGTATLFLDDVRVSTNVRLFETERALGTRVSAAVRRRVLEEGRTWLDRAFVVDDWYISAYEPLRDGAGETIGMLYVGFLDAPYEAAKTRTLLTAAGVFAAAIVLGVPVLLLWARGIFKPLERMSRAIARVEAGDRRARAGASGGLGDEIALVAAHLDHLLDVIEERETRLRGLNETLEARVDARTAELREANRRLEAATRQLIVSEKLAAIGEITAGVAHEINNPLAVMQGNLDVILDSLSPDQAADLKTEFQLVQQQIQRVHELVSKLLQFSRPEEYAEAPEGHAPAAAMEEALTLVGHMLGGAGVEVTRELPQTAQVGMNRAELQQVLVNLMVNAIQAMPGGGALRVAVRDEARGGAPGVAFEVADTGRGMEAAVAGRVFDPFFTTRHGEGTGLGLSISRKLVERGGGEIGVESAPGEGSVFTLWLPAA